MAASTRHQMRNHSDIQSIFNQQDGLWKRERRRN